MRASFGHANEEIDRLFGEARARFEATADDIRGLSRKIHREIEETRDEVRRGAIELPRETAEQAAALRRVVGDQVKALNELTDIVARSGRVYRRRRAGAAAARVALSRRPAPAPIRHPRRRQPRPNPGPPASRQGGWLSDLLARASRDDAPKAAGQNGAGPASSKGGFSTGLTLDIARMVDNAAASDLWRRYQRGEKGGCSVAVSTPRKAIRPSRKFVAAIASIRRFARPLDHYVRHFEDLLSRQAAATTTAPRRSTC